VGNWRADSVSTKAAAKILQIMSLGCKFDGKDCVATNWQIMFVTGRD
jgi:hypothetical protein